MHLSVYSKLVMSLWQDLNRTFERLCKKLDLLEDKP